MFIFIYDFLSFTYSKTLEDMIKIVCESVACSDSGTPTKFQKFSYSLFEALLSCDYCVRKEVRTKQLFFLNDFTFVYIAKTLMIIVILKKKKTV